MHSRLFLVCVSIHLFLPCVVCLAQEEQVLGKKRSEWLGILKSHPETKFRRAAVIALEVIGPRSPGVLDSLYEAIDKDADPEVRRDIALTLGRMGAEAKGAVNVLGDTLKHDKTGKVREAAAMVLAGKLNDQAQSQVMALAGALKDSHAGTRAAAAEALKNLGEKARLALPQLTALAQDVSADRFARLYAIQMISRWGDEKTLQVLVAIFEDKGTPPAIKHGVIEGIGRMGEKAQSAAPVLARALKDTDVEVRRKVAVALAQMGTSIKASWPAIKEGYQDSDNAVRNQIIRIAGLLAKDEKSAIAVLAEAAEKDVNLENRLAALQELGELGATAVQTVPLLKRLATDDPRTTIREAAQAAVRRIAGN